MLQEMVTAAGDRGGNMVLIVHVASDDQLLDLMKALYKKEWKSKLHTWCQPTQARRGTFKQDHEVWMVCWLGDDPKPAAENLVQQG